MKKTHVGERIKQLREERGMTQQMLADKIGMSKSTIAKYENNQLHPSLDVIVKIAEHFDASLDYITGRSKIRSKDPHWYSKLPPELQRFAEEQKLEYLEISLMAEEKGWTKEAIEEVMEVVEKFSTKGDKTK